VEYGDTNFSQASVDSGENGDVLEMYESKGASNSFRGRLKCMSPATVCFGDVGDSVRSRISVTGDFADSEVPRGR
jgi:hypothetical protein